MNPTMQEMQSHPLMQQMVADIEKKKSNEQVLQADQAFKAGLARANAVKDARETFDAALKEYEVIRKQLHASVGKLFLSNLAYSRLTGHPHNQFPENVFMTIHIPKLNSPNDWTTSFSTTQQAYQQYFTVQRWV